MESKLTKRIEKLIKNRMNIPSKKWSKAENGETVFWILNREDGTAGSYETSQERLGITINGEIMWGFTSGCSCWNGWGADEYEGPITYKEFLLKNIGTTKDRYGNEIKKYDLSFITGWEEEISENLDLLDKEIEEARK